MTYARFSGVSPAAPGRSAGSAATPRRVQRPPHGTHAPAAGQPAAQRAPASAAPAAPRVRQHERQPLRRIGRVQRHVRAAGLEHAQHARPPSPAPRSRHSPTRTSGPTPQPREVVRQLVRARVQLARRSALAPRRPPPPRPACAPPAPRRARGCSRSRRVRGRRRVPRLQHLRALRLAAAAAARESRALRRPRRPAPAARSQVPEHPLDRARVEQVACAYSSAAAQAPRVLRQRAASGRTWRVSASAPTRSAPQPRQRQAPPSARSAATNITWKSGVWLRLALRLQLLHQLLERHVLVRVRAQRRLPHPPQQLAEARVAREIACAAPAC